VSDRTGRDGAHCMTCTCKSLERIELARRLGVRELAGRLGVTVRSAQRYVKAAREDRTEVTFSKWR